MVAALALRGADDGRPLHGVVSRRVQQRDRRDHHGSHGDEAAGGSPRRERPPVPPVLGGPALAQRRGQRRPRAAQLLNGAAAMPSVGKTSSAASSGPLGWVALVSAAAMPAIAEQSEQRLGPVGPQRLPPLGLLAGLGRAQERGLAGRTGRAPRPARPPARWTAR